MLYRCYCTPALEGKWQNFRFYLKSKWWQSGDSSSVQDDARPVKGIQFHLPQLSLRGRDIAGTCNSIFNIVILVVYILCDINSIYLQNIYIYCRRFLTYFFPENIGSSPVDVLCWSGNKHAIASKPSDKVTCDDDGPTTATEVLPCGLWVWNSCWMPHLGAGFSVPYPTHTSCAS